ncbi:acyl carrier protein [Mangrovihabitans endophyticus]|uniref:Phosphopantetheine attachment site domain protein n=1 Tax=Mangrovihabitans endophyticus TaxID=1751298 RepID=A0A8J3BTI5_9ACTN|nr:acyl carrier protein [Mangrovihabitans endophyticus]GGK73225.1 phosphopantetheine attachment site domain protein [Mangrovihabitans endophyticus]
MTPSAGDDLRGWLTMAVARHLERPPAEVDASTPLSQYGLDSVHAFALAEEIEDHLGVAVEPTITLERPTIDELVAYLAAVRT